MQILFIEWIASVWSPPFFAENSAVSDTTNPSNRFPRFWASAFDCVGRFLVGEGEVFVGISINMRRQSFYYKSLET